MKRFMIITLHLSYWLMFLFLLFIFFLLFTPYTPDYYKHFFSFWISKWIILMIPFAIVPGLISFYTFYLVLFPKYLWRKKLLALFLTGMLTSVLCGIIGEIILSFIHQRIFPAPDMAEIIVVLVFVSFGAMMNGIVGLVINGFITWYGDIKLKEDLNKKNYEMELDLIKAQINPHFLFNTLNNIDMLIQIDAPRASAYLNKLSDIMRFMLYETKSEKIELAREFEYIEKYIELQKIRTSNPRYIRYRVHGNADGIRIEPMLFMPFIENAFKYAENKQVENAIDISFEIDPKNLTFHCKNHYTHHDWVKPDHGGLGNELIKKRLKLLYPHHHTLEIRNEDHIYHVTLTICQHES